MQTTIRIYDLLFNSLQLGSLIHKTEDYDTILSQHKFTR